jgi:hypothetical protein
VIWGLVAIQALFGFPLMIWELSNAENAPQQAAIAAMAAAAAIIPYVFARALDGFREAGERGMSQRKEPS